VSTRVIYPGSFDPITVGHLDIVGRAVDIFGELKISVVKRSRKELLFDVGEREELARRSVAEAGLEDRVAVESFEGLLVEHMRRTDARIFVRGLRATSDFEYEFQMELMNRRLAPEITGVYLMPSESNIYLSSTVVKEIASYGGELRTLVMPAVEKALRKRFGKR
jgi:pantetheine-phosphate adenylyltransferase